MKADKRADYNGLLVRSERYASRVKDMFDNTTRDMMELSRAYEMPAEGELFSFEDNKRLEKRALDLLRQLHSQVYVSIRSDIELEWSKANDATDSLLKTALGKSLKRKPELSAWYNRNTDALDAFLSRKVDGLGLSDRVWKPVTQLRSEMELAISASIGEGTSAATMSRRVRKYLNEPDRLFRRIKFMGADGKIHERLSNAAKAYHPGMGVYRSSYKNAMRLTRTETNMAYRRADSERWMELDFVTGIRIALSHNHPIPDICDELAGDYPKNFIFTGWHPQCFCHATPIMCSDERFIEMQQALIDGQPVPPPDNVIDAMPEAFTEWAKHNMSRIEAARQRGTLPLFLRENFADGIPSGTLLRKLPKPNPMTATAAAARKVAEHVPIEQLNASARAEWERFKDANNPYDGDTWDFLDACHLYGIDADMYRAELKLAVSKDEYWRMDGLRAERNRLDALLRKVMADARVKAERILKDFENALTDTEKWIGRGRRDILDMGYAELRSTEKYPNYISIINAGDVTYNVDELKKFVERVKSDYADAQDKAQRLLNEISDWEAREGKQLNIDTSKLTALMQEELTADRTARKIYNELSSATYKVSQKFDIAKKEAEVGQLLTNTPIDTHIENLMNNNVEYKRAVKMNRALTHDEIVAKIAGGDMTDGSCASLVWAYAGNMAGYDVRDFRGGSSCYYFARHTREIVSDFMNGQHANESSDVKCALKLFKGMKADEPYYLGCGRHASIVQKDMFGNVFYLEQQDPYASGNGWKLLGNANTEAQRISGKLRWRFDAKVRKLTGNPVLANIKDMQAHPAFQTILGFINTDESEQMKSSSGGIK